MRTLASNEENSVCDAAIKALAETLPADHEGADAICDLERRGPEALANLFRRSGTAGLAVPTAVGGPGAAASDLSRLVRWVGGRSPSLALMMTMHHHTVAGFASLAQYQPSARGMLRQVAKSQLLVASAFAEGRPQSDIVQNHSVRAREVEGGYVLTGSKRPCTMTHTMDLMLVGITLGDAASGGRIGTAIVNARDPNLQRRPFWRSPYLLGADSHEVVFADVYVPRMNVSISEEIAPSLEGSADSPENVFLAWFQLLASSAYAGMCARLVAEARRAAKRADGEVAELLIQTAATEACLLELGRIVDAGRFRQTDLAHCYALRYAVQERIVHTASCAVELLGGLESIQREDWNYLKSCVGFLSFHPPAMRSRTGFLAENYSHG